jgi:iron-sulfur cluster insertion protein
MTDILIFTKDAAEKVKSLMEEETNMVGLRVYVQGGGCSGFQYGFTFVEQPEEGDTVVETDGVKLFIDPMSHQYLEGATVDFVINNPNASTTCGCGQSFS